MLVLFNKLFSLLDLLSQQVYLVVKGIVDIKAEIQKMEAKKKKLESDLEGKTDLKGCHSERLLTSNPITGWKKKLTAPNYETKVPENVRKLNSEKVLAFSLWLGICFVH